MQQTLTGCAFCIAQPRIESGEAHTWGKDERVTHPICIDCAIQKRHDTEECDRHACDGCGLVVDALAALTRFRVVFGHLEGPLYLCAGCSPNGPATYWTRDLEEHVVAESPEGGCIALHRRFTAKIPPLTKQTDQTAMFQWFQHLPMSGGTIDIEEFEDADVDEFDERNDTERIVTFLDEHDDRAWKAATIADQLGLDSDAVNAILSRLKARGLVRHKRPYWAITDDEGRLRAAYRLHQHYEAADEEYGEEQLESVQTDDMEPVE